MANNPKHMDNLKPIKKGEVRNPHGRPRKLISNTIKDLEARGVKKTSKDEILDVYLRIMNMEIDELQKEVKDNKQTVLFRIVGKAVLSGKGFDIIEKMLDRSIGRPDQKMDHTTKGKEIKFSDGEREKRIIELLKKRDADKG